MKVKRLAFVLVSMETDSFWAKWAKHSRAAEDIIHELIDAMLWEAEKL